MAFKNLFTPNIATCTDFLKNTTGLESINGGIISSSLEQTYDGSYTLKIRTPGSVIHEGMTMISMKPTQTVGQTYTFSGRVWVPPGISLCAAYGGGVQTITNSGSFGAWFHFAPSFTATNQHSMAVYTVLAQTVTFYLDILQFELGSVATAWEFPGIDLTGQAILTAEQVQNIKLNSLLRAFSIESTENVPNLTVESILQLLGVSTSEYVNNLDVMNSIFLEAIESTETVQELITWVYCEFIHCKITMNAPNSIQTMRQ